MRARRTTHERVTEWFEWNRTLQVLVAVAAAALVAAGSLVGFVIGVNL